MEGLLNQLVLEHLQLAPLQWGEYAPVASGRARAFSRRWLGRWGWPGWLGWPGPICPEHGPSGAPRQQPQMHTWWWAPRRPHLPAAAESDMARGGPCAGPCGLPSACVSGPGVGGGEEAQGAASSLEELRQPLTGSARRSTCLVSA